MVQTLPSNAGGEGSIPGWGTKVYMIIFNIKNHFHNNFFHFLFFCMENRESIT